MNVVLYRTAVWGAGAVSLLLTVMPGVGRAADDLPLVGEIRMPSVNVDVDVDIDRIGAPPPRRRIVYSERPLTALPPPPIMSPGIGIVEPPAIAPHEVSAILRSNGYSPLGPVIRRGWVYTTSAIDPRGDDGRVIIDARTGRIMRFIPAYAVSDNLNEQLRVVYGPPGPPPVIEPPRLARVPLPSPKMANLPPRGPKVVSRTEPAAQAAPVSTRRADRLAITPAQRAAMNQIKPARATPPADSKPLEAKPAPSPATESKPSEPAIRPTPEMPAVQGLE